MMIIGKSRYGEKNMGMLGMSRSMPEGYKLPNIPYLPHYHGNSQRACHG